MRQSVAEPPVRALKHLQWVRSKAVASFGRSNVPTLETRMST